MTTFRVWVNRYGWPTAYIVMLFYLTWMLWHSDVDGLAFSIFTMYGVSATWLAVLASIQNADKIEAGISSCASCGGVGSIYIRSAHPDCHSDTWQLCPECKGMSLFVVRR